jgi:uncharacterized protein
MHLTAEQILDHKEHRPFPLPDSPYVYYQEWRKAIFLHYEADPSQLEKLIPSFVKLDLFEGKAYVSLVAFTVCHARAAMLPSFAPISDFHEVNLRTYVTDGKHPGIFFLSMEASKFSSAFLSRAVTGLPYEYSSISRKEEAPYEYHSRHEKKGFHFDAVYTPSSVITNPLSIDKWLVERYCVYMQLKRLGYRYDVHHLPWQLQNIELSQLSCLYRAGANEYRENMIGSHYSEGVQVLLWEQQHYNTAN